MSDQAGSKQRGLVQVGSAPPRRQALSVKAKTGKFLGLHAEKPAKANAAKTPKYSGKDFVYGVLFVTLVAFGAQKPVNRTAKWF